MTQQEQNLSYQTQIDIGLLSPPEMPTPLWLTPFSVYNKTVQSSSSGFQSGSSIPNVIGAVSENPPNS